MEREAEAVYLLFIYGYLSYLPFPSSSTPPALPSAPSSSFALRACPPLLPIQPTQALAPRPLPAMATVLIHSYAPAPRQGILLNPSPLASPAYHPASLPPLVPSNSSLSSSASSSAPGDATDYFPKSAYSSASGPSQTPSVPHRSSVSRPSGRNGSMPSAPRKIRFAPLPQPRREDEDAYPPVFLDDDDAPAEQQLTVSSALAAAGTSYADSKHLTASPRPPRRALPADSLLLDPSPESSDPVSAAEAQNPAASSDCGHDWDVVSGSPTLGPVALPSPDSPRKAKWASLLKPLLGRSSGLAREDAAAFEAPRGRSARAGASSRESSVSRDASLTRERRGSDFGAPLYRWTSEGGSITQLPISKKKRHLFFGSGGGGAGGVPLGRTQSLTSLSGKDEKKSKPPPRPIPVANRGRKQTRLLNGRVYGARRNPFANVRYDSPFP